jgi:glucosamine kinase
MMAADLFVAVDGGGSTCRAAIADASGKVFGRGRQGSANVHTDLAGAAANIAAAAADAAKAAGIDAAALGAMPAFLGLAGVNTGIDEQAVSERLPFARCVVEDDAVIALQGAFGDGDGIVAVLGTGSVYISRHGATISKAGGWGFVVGDLGSGARLARALLQETLLAHDGIVQHTPLTRAVMAQFDNDPVKLVLFAQTEKPGGFALFAPMVFDYAEKGDAVGRALVKGAVAHVDAALGAVTWPGCEALCLMGGLTPLYRDRIEPRFRAMLREPKGDALLGAVELGRRAFFAGKEGAA